MMPLLTVSQACAYLTLQFAKFTMGPRSRLVPAGPRGRGVRSRRSARRGHALLDRATPRAGRTHTQTRQASPSAWTLRTSTRPRRRPRQPRRHRVTATSVAGGEPPWDALLRLLARHSRTAAKPEAGQTSSSASKHSVFKRKITEDRRRIAIENAPPSAARRTAFGCAWRLRGWGRAGPGRGRAG